MSTSRNSQKNGDKASRLEKIRDEVFYLKESPLYEYRTENKYYPVIGEGSYDARILFIGEAPGKNEALSGRPFCGAAGKILDKLIASIGLKREDVYITNIVKDRPPENRDPSPEEIALYAPFLDRQIEIIEPRIIATLGRYSMSHIMNAFKVGDLTLPISKVHGRAFEFAHSYGNVSFIPLYHPAAVIYNRALMGDLEKDFLTLKSLAGV